MLKLQHLRWGISELGGVRGGEKLLSLLLDKGERLSKYTGLWVAIDPEV